MRPYLLIGGALGALALAGAFAQQQHPMQHEHGHSPYARQEASGISSLSRQELDELLAGDGMGLARAAELNRYPGPKHVLELADELGLTAPQRAGVEAIRLEMLEEARRIGAEIVEKERHLDRHFAHQHIDESTLRAVTIEIASLRGTLRFVHLRAHLQTRELLSGDQVEAYDHLRGYSARAPSSGAAPDGPGQK